MRTFTNLVLALTVVSMVAACGSSRTDRTLSGAGIGAAGGAAVGAVTGGNPLTGAILGGAAGAAAGGLTDEDDFNLGDPIWDSHPIQDASKGRAAQRKPGGPFACGARPRIAKPARRC